MLVTLLLHARHDGDDVAGDVADNEVAGDDNAQQLGLVNNFKGLRIRERELWEKVIVFAGVKGHNLSFLDIDKHLVSISESL